MEKTHGFDLGEKVMYYNGGEVEGPFKVTYLYPSGSVCLDEVEAIEDDLDSSDFVVADTENIFYEDDVNEYIKILARKYVWEVNSDEVDEIVDYMRDPEKQYEEGIVVQMDKTFDGLIDYNFYFLEEVKFDRIQPWFEQTFGYYGEDRLYYHPDIDMYSWVSYY